MNNLKKFITKLQTFASNYYLSLQKYFNLKVKPKFLEIIKKISNFFGSK